MRLAGSNRWCCWKLVAYSDWIAQLRRQDDELFREIRPARIIYSSQHDNNLTTVLVAT